MKGIHEIAAQSGAYHSEDVLKKHYIEKVIYKASNLLSVGTKLVGVEGFKDLHVEFSYPAETEIDYPVAEGAHAQDRKVKWSTFNLNLEKAVGSIVWTDESVIRSIANVQRRVSMSRVAEAMAKEMDNNIITTIEGGAGATGVSVNASKKWNSTSAEIDKDIMDAWGNIMDESNVSTADMKNLAVLIPAKCDGYVKTSTLLGNVQQTWEDYLKQKGIIFYPSRELTTGTDAYVIVKGEKTAIHGFYNGSAVKKVEFARNAKSGIDEYIVRKWFNTAIIEDDGLTAQTYRISKITGVL